MLPGCAGAIVGTGTTTTGGLVTTGAGLSCELTAGDVAGGAVDGTAVGAEMVWVG